MRPDGSLGKPSRAMPVWRGKPERTRHLSSPSALHPTGMTVSMKAQSPVSKVSISPPAVELHAPFDHVYDAADLVFMMFGKGIAASAGQLDHLRLEPRWCRREVQRYGLPRFRGAACGLKVRLAGDGQQVAIRFAKKMTHAHPVDAADGGQGWKGGGHAIGLQLGKQRRGQTRLGGQAGKCEPLLSAQRAQLHADTIGFKRPLCVGYRLGHHGTFPQLASRESGEPGKILEVFPIWVTVSVRNTACFTITARQLKKERASSGSSNTTCPVNIHYRNLQQTF